MENQNQALVSIGIPVHNGEAGIASALDSVLSQEYTNLEIVISDNASTDSTQSICERYAQNDSRIKYFRSEKNHGSSWNFNRVFELSMGKYFLWVAHDDQRDLSMVRECVSKMEQFPEAVLCQVRTAQYIAGQKELLCTVHLDSVELEKELVPRYRKVLQNPPAMAMYALYRSSIMNKTAMIQKIMAGDLVFLLELSFYGPFVQVPKTLFTYIGREKWSTVSQNYFVFYGTGNKPWWYLPFLILFLNHWSRVKNSDFPFSVKLKLWAILINHEIRQGALTVLIKTTGLICPERWRIKLGSAIYWRWMHMPDIEVGCDELYFENVIKHKLGWWK